MTLNKGLLFALGFVMILVLTLRLENELVKSNRPELDLSVQAIQLNNKIRQEANIHSMVQKAFGHFRDVVSINYKSLFRYGWPPDFLAQDLPPHQLAVALVDNNGVLLDCKNLAGQIDSEFIAKFTYIDYLKTRHYKEDVLFNPKYEGLMQQANLLLSEFIGCALDRVAFMQMRAGRLTTFKSTTALTGIYWDKMAVSPEHNVYFFSRLNLHEMSPLHIYERLAQSEQETRFAVAFYSSTRHEFVAGSGRPVVRKASDAKFMRKVCQDFLIEMGMSSQSRTEMFWQGNLAVVVGSEVTGTGLLPVVVTRLKSESAGFVFGPSTVATFAGICLVVFLFVQTAVFGRGLKLSVGKVLILASLLAIFMPFLLGRSIFKLILKEASDSEQLKIERNLYNTLGGIDSGVRLYNANLFQSFLRSFSHPETLESLKQARQQQAIYDKKLASDSESIDFSKHDAAILQIAERAFAPFFKGYNVETDIERTANAILVMGPDNFMRYFDRFKREIVGHKPESRNDTMFLLLNLFRKGIEKFFSRNEFVEGLLENKKNVAAEEMEKVFYDEVKAQLVSSIGAERFYEIFSKLDGLSSLRTTLGTTLFAVFPLRINGLIEYFCGIGWDEYSIGESYLKRVFTNIINVAEDQNGIESFFELLDPAALISAAPILIQTFSGMRAEYFCSQKTESSRLSMMVRSASRSRRVLRQDGTGDDQAIYQALAGRYLSLYTIGGRQDTSHLGRIEFWRHLIFMAGMLVFVIFAVFAAVNISRSFTGPLEHLLWGLKRIEAGNYEVKLKDAREDEFGSISRAFNRMVKGLRERNALGSFVSESVRRLARSPELFEKAQQGSEAKYTILFADFAGFAKFAASASEKEVQQKLEFSLEHFFKYAEDSGGEVDKVIGEKLLITFSHEQQGKKNAAIAAIKLARRIINDFKSDKHIKPLFGINSGRVISGIIGTPEVRIDNTVIGDPVNVASRMCSLADSKDRPIIISGAIRDCLGAGYRVKPVAVEKIRGKKQEVEVFSLEV